MIWNVILSRGGLTSGGMETWKVTTLPNRGARQCLAFQADPTCFASWIERNTMNTFAIYKSRGDTRIDCTRDIYPYHRSFRLCQSKSSIILAARWRLKVDSAFFRLSPRLAMFRHAYVLCMWSHKGTWPHHIRDGLVKCWKGIRNEKWTHGNLIIPQLIVGSNFQQ